MRGDSFPESIRFSFNTRIFERDIRKICHFRVIREMRNNADIPSGRDRVAATGGAADDAYDLRRARLFRDDDAHGARLSCRKKGGGCAPGAADGADRAALSPFEVACSRRAKTGPHSCATCRASADVSDRMRGPIRRKSRRPARFPGKRHTGIRIVPRRVRAQLIDGAVDAAHRTSPAVKPHGLHLPARDALLRTRDAASRCATVRPPDRYRCPVSLRDRPPSRCAHAATRAGPPRRQTLLTPTRDGTCRTRNTGLHSSRSRRHGRAPGTGRPARSRQQLSHSQSHALSQILSHASFRIDAPPT